MTAINNLIAISDLHCGCKFGLCPPGVRLDGGSVWTRNDIQKSIWTDWRYFWDRWVPKVTRGEPFAVVINGDALDGRHHNATTQVSQNLDDQERIALAALEPIVEACDGRLYMVAGTPSHVGESAENEERLARQLGAVPGQDGRHARYELWIRVGEALCHFAHHIGTTGRAAYETSALMAELIEMFVEASKQRLQPPDIVVRSHRHRHIEVKIPTASTYGICFTTAAWQAKTPFAYKIPGGRVTLPQFGGSLIRQGDEEFYTRHLIFALERPETEIIGEDVDEV